MSIPSYPIQGLSGTVSFGTVICNEISIIPRSTPFNILMRGPTFASPNNTTSLRSGQTLGYPQGAYLAPLLLLGTTQVNWIMDIFDTSELYVGLYGSGDFNNPANPNILPIFLSDRLISSARVITVSLTTTNIIVYEGAGVGTNVLASVSLGALVGSSMYPWICCPANALIQIDNIRQDTRFVITCLSNGGSFMTGTGNGITDFSIADIIDNGGGGPLPPSNAIENGSGQSVFVEPGGTILSTGGIAYAPTTVSANTTLAASSSYIIVDNAAVTAVTLPPVVSGQSYLIVRDYPAQPGENIFSPVLSIFPDGAETIGGYSSLGIPPFASLRLTGYGSGWVIG